MTQFSYETVSKIMQNLRKPWNSLTCLYRHLYFYACLHLCFNYSLASSLTQCNRIVAELLGTYENPTQRPSYQHGRPDASTWFNGSYTCLNAGWEIMASREGHVCKTPYKIHGLPSQTLQREQETHGNGHGWKSSHVTWETPLLQKMERPGCNGRFWWWMG